MIKITESIFIDEKNITFQFVRSGGPGGQNVNKVATAAELRFDLYTESLLPLDVKNRLIKIAKNRISKDGFLIIFASEYRTQKKNRDAAVSRLIELIKDASVIPSVRRETKPSKTAKENRLAEKKKLSRSKKLRKIDNIIDE